MVSVQVGGQGAAQLLGQLDGVLRGVVHPGPGGEHGARHEDHPLEVRLSDHRAVHQILHTGRAHTLGSQILHSTVQLYTLAPSRDRDMNSPVNN